MMRYASGTAVSSILMPRHGRGPYSILGGAGGDGSSRALAGPATVPPSTDDWEGGDGVGDRSTVTGRARGTGAGRLGVRGRARVPRLRGGGLAGGGRGPYGPVHGHPVRDP